MSTLRLPLGVAVRAVLEPEPESASTRSPSGPIVKPSVASRASGGARRTQAVASRRRRPEKPSASAPRRSAAHALTLPTGALPRRRCSRSRSSSRQSSPPCSRGTYPRRRGRSPGAPRHGSASGTRATATTTATVASSIRPSTGIGSARHAGAHERPRAASGRSTTGAAGPGASSRRYSTYRRTRRPRPRTRRQPAAARVAQRATPRHGGDARDARRDVEAGRRCRVRARHDRSQQKIALDPPSEARDHLR